VRAALGEDSSAFLNGAEREYETGSRFVFISAARCLDCRRVYDEAGDVIKTHEHAGEVKEW
jgi:hypothetical protein